MQVNVNGAQVDLGPGTTVAALVAERAAGTDRVAVALNGEVVPRSRWASTDLAAGDSVEVLAPTAGG